MGTKEEIDPYSQMILDVFSCAAGEKLMDEWQKMYGDRISYSADVNPEGVAFFEGERHFYLHIKQTLEIYK